MIVTLIFVQTNYASAQYTTTNSSGGALGTTEWYFSHNNSNITYGSYNYFCEGYTKDGKAMDSGNVRLTILRNAPTNVIVDYVYDEEFFEYEENNTRYGDSAQVGYSSCYIDITDNFYGGFELTLTYNQ